ncbi:hypothetical protein EJ08DRAFT_650681 [Tothia fuscella]|uniref:Uncharacterized protein n=1 Tax=Tothia fuscella TaxID=1048955 RepID=A0A9P4TX12_9PEZI|nr:hypothetical protein EJ08DRAFT_650681 [Tothia fuscella]
MYLSPDLATKLQNTVKQKCKNLDDPDCLRSVGELLKSDKVNLRTRQLGVAAGVGVALEALAAWVVAFIALTEVHNKPIHMNIPADHIETIQKVSSTASLVAIATDANDKHPVTITLNLEATEFRTTPLLTTATADANDRKTGDVIFTLPKELNNRVEDWIAMHCPSRRRMTRKRAFDPTCVPQAAQGVLQNAGPDGPLKDLLIMPYKLPEFDVDNVLPKVADVVRGTNDLLVFMKEHAKDLGIVLVGTRAESLTRLVYWLVYARIVLNEVATKTDHHIPAEYVQKKKKKQDGVRCHLPDRVPFCSNCGGSLLNLPFVGGLNLPVCLGYPEHQFQYVGCPCIPNPTQLPFKRNAGVDFAQRLLWAGFFSGAKFQPPTDEFKLHVHQRMKLKESSIEWTMFDSNNKIVGGPSNNGKATGASKEVKIDVFDPTDKDKTTTRFSYGDNDGRCSIFWITEVTKAGGKKAQSINCGSGRKFYCDDLVRIGWKDWNGGGFEREFDCFVNKK